jgi:hypothetical protein
MSFVGMKKRPHRDLAKREEFCIILLHSIGQYHLVFRVSATQPMDRVLNFTLTSRSFFQMLDKIIVRLECEVVPTIVGPYAIPLHDLLLIHDSSPLHHMEEVKCSEKMMRTYCKGGTTSVSVMYFVVFAHITILNLTIYGTSTCPSSTMYFKISLFSISCDRCKKRKSSTVLHM